MNLYFIPGYIATIELLLRRTLVRLVILLCIIEDDTFTQRRYNIIPMCGDEHRSFYFFRTWTRTEAALKVGGQLWFCLYPPRWSNCLFLF